MCKFFGKANKQGQPRKIAHTINSVNSGSDNRGGGGGGEAKTDPPTQALAKINLLATDLVGEGLAENVWLELCVIGLG